MSWLVVSFITLKHAIISALLTASFVWNLTGGENWLPGTIDKCLGTLTFLVQLEDGRSVCRHVDHIQARSPATDTTIPEDLDMPDINIESKSHANTSAMEALLPALRHSARVSVPPDHYSPSSN